LWSGKTQCFDSRILEMNQDFIAVGFGTFDQCTSCCYLKVISTAQGNLQSLQNTTIGQSQ
jgi:hypothetical protein